MKFKFLSLFLIVTSLVYAQDINQFDENGKRHGVWKKNFEGTKQLRYEGQFDHGKEVGEFKFYKLVKKKSVLTATKLFDLDGSAYVKFLASTGKTISEGKQLGKLYVGEWKYYHNKSDKVMTLEHYNNKGSLEGERLVYYKDGVVAERANYVDGKKQGIYYGYSVKGVVLRELNYENDELNGLAKHFNGKGELLAEGNYYKGKKKGIWKYYENGELVKEDNIDAVKKKSTKQ
jgi:antitoxin component YwqK of YwqJK toxin-antitoxin module